jgi:hypothetical protein
MMATNSGAPTWLQNYADYNMGSWIPPQLQGGEDTQGGGNNATQDTTDIAIVALNNNKDDMA